MIRSRCSTGSAVITRVFSTVVSWVTAAAACAGATFVSRAGSFTTIVGLKVIEDAVVVVVVVDAEEPVEGAGNDGATTDGTAGADGTVAGAAGATEGIGGGVAGMTAGDATGGVTGAGVGATGTGMLIVLFCAAGCC